MKNNYLTMRTVFSFALLGVTLCFSDHCTASNCTSIAVNTASNTPYLMSLGVMGIHIPAEWRDIFTIACGVCIILLMFRLWEEHQNQKRSIEYMKYEAEKAKLAEAHRLEQLRAEADKQLAQARIKRLNAELNTKREAMHRVLVERIELARHIRQYAQTSNTGIPKWLQQYLDGYSFANPAKWQAFMKEFNQAYNGYIPYLQQRYPTLTDSDLQYLVLATLGFDCSDIAYLLNKTDRTIWNRRDIIKNRISDTSLHLEEWLSRTIDEYKALQLSAVDICTH